MQVDAIAVQLRPRTMSEASDLGVRLVQAHARSVWRSFLPVYAVILLLALASGAWGDWLPALVIFWLKPWLDRSVLFVLSRAVFGMPTRFADLWQAQRRVWWQQLLPSLTTRRLSPWRSYVAPAQQLEGQRGQVGAARRVQLLAGKQGAALGMHTVFANFEALLTLGVMTLGLLFAPGDTHLFSWSALLQGDDHFLTIASGVVYAAVVGLLEPFYVGAGFAMYLNRRVELEAWDVEQEFRLVFGH
jgi:hypothetical protein